VGSVAALVADVAVVVVAVEEAVVSMPVVAISPKSADSASTDARGDKEEDTTSNSVRTESSLLHETP
jgi:hypothetical protein